MADSEQVRLARIELAKRELARRQGSSFDVNSTNQSVQGTPYSQPNVALGAAYEVASEMAPWNVARSLTTEPAGEAVAEAGGRMGFPVAGAIAGTAVQMAPDIAGMLLQGPETTPRNVFAAKPTPQTLPGVQAAKRLDVPLTRAEVTGSKADALFESALEKTWTGSGPIRAQRQVQSTALQSAAERTQGQYGTRLPPSVVGQEVQLGTQSNMRAAAKTDRSLWADIPNDAIETPKLLQVLDESVGSQSGIQDPKVVSAVSRIRAALTRQEPITEATFPKSIGSTQRTKEVIKPPHVEMEPGTGNVFHPESKSEQVFDLKSQYRMGPIEPETQGPPRFNELQKVRQLLKKEIDSETTWDPVMGMKTTDTGRRLQNIKSALDSDISAYGSPNPSDDKLSEFLGSEFKDRFQKAKTFHGAFKELKDSKLAGRISSKAPSEMVDKVLLPGRIEDVNTAKALMGQEGFQTLKKGFFNRLMESKNLGRELGKYDDEFLNSVLNSEEMGSLRDLVSTRERALGAEKLAGNPSGTAQNVSTMAQLGALGHATVKAFTNPIGAAVQAGAILAGPRLAANAYIKYGVSGYPVVTKNTGNLLQKLALGGKSVADGERRNRLSQYIDRLIENRRQ